MKKLILLVTILALTHAACDDHGRRGQRRPHDRDKRHVTPPPHPPRLGRDPFEPNNDRDRPSRIAVGRPQVHTIFPEDDEDWILCPLPGPGEYEIMFTHTTVKLTVDVWVNHPRERDEEEKIETFDVKQTRGIIIRAHPRTRYIRLKVRAEDDDRKGQYQLAIQRIR